MKVKDMLIPRIPDRLFQHLSNAYYGIRFRKEKVNIKPCGNHWLIKKGSISLFSPTPKFIGLPSLKSFSNRFEKFFQIKPGDICLDVGACIGDTTVPMAIKTGRKGTIIAVEPEPLNILFLYKNLLNLNNPPTCIIVVKAAWNAKTTIQFNIHSTPTGHSLIDKFKDSIKVEADTLDNILKGEAQIDFAKIDVQGAELQLLEGAEEMLLKTRNIVVETHYFGEKALYPKVAHILKQRGFNVRVTGDRIVHGWRPKQ